jgi:hypothetical protein
MPSPSSEHLFAFTTLDHEHLFVVNTFFEQLFAHGHTIDIGCDGAALALLDNPEGFSQD